MTFDVSALRKLSYLLTYTVKQMSRFWISGKIVVIWAPMVRRVVCKSDVYFCSILYISAGVFLLHVYASTVHFNTEEPVASQTNGAQGISTSTAASPQGSATSMTGAQGISTMADQGGISSMTARRRKSATRKSSCKQQ